MTLERSYNVPLRKGMRKAPSYQRTNRAISELRQFLQKHMKSEDVVLLKELNNHMWKHGAKNPPGKVSVICVKDKKGKVHVNLEGHKPKVEEEKTEKKATPKAPEKKEEKPEAKEVPAKEEKTEAKTKPAPAAAPEKKPAPKTAEKEATPEAKAKA